MANIDLYGLVKYNFQANESNYSFPQNCSSLQCHALAMITYTPASNLGYLAPPPPRTIFHGCQIVHWDPLDGKRRCPQKNFGLGYVKLHGFYANP